MLKKPLGCNGKLVLAENKRKKMLTRTKNAEMSKRVSNSEIHLHHCLCESRGFEIGKSNHRRCSVKSCSWKFCKIDRKELASESDTGFLLTVLWNFWEYFFYRTLPGDCFWWRTWLSKILIPLSFLKKIFVEIIGVFNPGSCWKKELCNSPRWPLGGTLHVNFQPGLKFIPGWIQLYPWLKLSSWLPA